MLSGTQDRIRGAVPVSIRGAEPEHETESEVPHRNPRQDPTRRAKTRDRIRGTVPSIDPWRRTETRDRIRDAAPVSIRDAEPEHKTESKAQHQYRSDVPDRNPSHNMRQLNGPSLEKRRRTLSICQTPRTGRVPSGTTRRCRPATGGLFRRPKSHAPTKAINRRHASGVTRPGTTSRHVPCPSNRKRAPLVTVSARQSPQRPGCAQRPPPAIDEPAGPSHGFPFWGFRRTDAATYRRTKIAAR